MNKSKFLLVVSVIVVFAVLVTLALVGSFKPIAAKASASDEASASTPTPVLIVSEPKADPTASPFVLEEPEGYALTKKFFLNLPNKVDFREAVINPGDKNNALIIFDRDYANVVLLRAVPDDLFLEITLHRADGSVKDLRAILEVQMMDKAYFANASAENIEVLKNRGVDVINGELLPQNLYSVNLGAITKGEYITVLLADDVKLGVNNGSLFTFGDAGDDLTKDLK